MRGIFVLLVAFWLVCLFVLRIPASAHGSGPPYVKVNNEYAQSNPILNIAQPTQFVVGADVASSSGYLLNEQIVFEVDEQFFPNPYAQAQNPFGIPVTNAPDIPTPMFRWDFKDGSEVLEGQRVVHRFSKPGTHVVELSAKFVGKTQDFAIVNTIQMEVYPSKDYQLLKSKIVVDGKTIADAQRDTAPIRPVAPIKFEALSDREAGKYYWDFGDNKGAEGKIVTHRYARDEYFPVAVLRSIDEHDISVDTYVLLDMPFEKPNFFLKIWYTVTDFLRGL